MSLNKNKLVSGIFKVAKSTSPGAAYDQWDILLKDYFFDQNIQNFRPKSASPIKPLFVKSEGKGFADDLPKNLASWATSIEWTNGKDIKKGIVPAPLDFKGFAASHKKDDGKTYVAALATLLHNWFSIITV
jgi:hypothetical protein